MFFHLFVCTIEPIGTCKWHIIHTCMYWRILLSVTMSVSTRYIRWHWYHSCLGFSTTHKNNRETLQRAIVQKVGQIFPRTLRGKGYMLDASHIQQRVIETISTARAMIFTTKRKPENSEPNVQWSFDCQF